MEIPERIIPPGEKDIEEVSLFKVTGSQKRFLDLFKEAMREVPTHKKSYRFRIKKMLEILDILTEYGIEISNRTIPENALLKDVIELLPEHLREHVIEETGEDLEYKIGEEYNLTKASFVDSSRNNVFMDYDIRDLRRMGIFEDTDARFYRDGIKVEAIQNGFVVRGKRAFLGLNIKTGKYVDEDGYNIQDVNLDTFFDRSGYYWRVNKAGKLESTHEKHDTRDFDKDHMYIKNGTPYNDYGFDVNGINKDTGTIYDARFFTEEGYYVIVKENGEYEITSSRYNPEGWSRDNINKKTQTIYDEYGFKEDKTWKETGRIYDDKFFTADGYFVIVDEKTGEVIVTDRKYDDRFFNRDRYYVEVKEDGTCIGTGKKYNPNRWDIDKNYVDIDEEGRDVFTGKPYNRQHCTEDGFYVIVEEDGSYEITDRKINELGKDSITNTGHLFTYTHVDDKTGNTIRFIHKEVADFIYSPMSKRGYCGNDGTKIKELNELIEDEKKNNSDIVGLIVEAERKSADLELEILPRIKSLTDILLQLKSQIDGMKNSRQQGSRKYRRIVEKYNALLRERKMLKLQGARIKKERAEKENQEAKTQNQEVKKSVDDLISQLFGGGK